MKEISYRTGYVRICTSFFFQATRFFSQVIQCNTILPTDLKSKIHEHFYISLNSHENFYKLRSFCIEPKPRKSSKQITSLCYLKSTICSYRLWWRRQAIPYIRDNYQCPEIQHSFHYNTPKAPRYPFCNDIFLWR